MTVGCEIKYRVGAKRREHLVAGGIDPFAKIFERTRTLAQVDTPNIATAMAAGHIRCEIEPVAVGRHRRVGVARYGVGCYLEFHRGAPFGIAALRGVDFDSGIELSSRRARPDTWSGRRGKCRGAFVDLGIEFSLYRFGAFPFATFVLVANHMSPFFMPVISLR